jgi:hypothetical protein
MFDFDGAECRILVPEFGDNLAKTLIQPEFAFLKCKAHEGHGYGFAARPKKLL